MNNKLVPTNNLWYRIKNFFRTIFLKEKNNNNKDFYNSSTNSIPNNNIITNNDLKLKFEIENQKQSLAKKLLCDELSPSDLEDNEIDDMIDYFSKDITNIDNELLRIKQHIISMQKELKQE